MRVLLFLFVELYISINIVYSQSELKIDNLISSRGKEYRINKFESGEEQYMDRDYRFNYVPDELKGCMHIKTCGNDKLISENDTCMSFFSNCDIDVYILFADKFPVTPNWLESFERTRLNVTRLDSNSSSLKGYFCLYRKAFSKGQIILNGCSPIKMLERNGFVESMGSGYCMYTVVVKKSN
ncbi:MAG: hypothetical protein A2W90_02800 [Bacteroidetes bacterium GWF2_42_66]|nr:MAG: hypothetical protein A2W92_19840 [Bacteroidetes bacterium GWA2_42_15]OFY01276.1 MAG: hypothetical protein A2W89_16285 [Bacteroidetes bacterium GWE2_42_39]OFY42120.1 MAG: hypothetical protein A2W90_02800 [Bacteroidetes bacterium GWF2_42_66]HBL77675.1 hypothetical protein [Prolixibacteraceae bacterium]HCB62804.1 hypothetical protein [Bacteroidales bacterium]